MTMRSFDFKKTYEEIKINGEVYKIDFSDAKLKEYRKSFNEFYAESQKMQSVNASELVKDDEFKQFDQATDLTKKAIDNLLGDGSFDKLYEQSGRSLFNMMDLVEFLAELVGEKTNKVRNERAHKYTKHKKQRHNGNKR
ncbi:hypothetical protein [Cytobacillus firmus]|uniref:Phage protein n=1 Tax=Cytobacillus firmus TaxID=1399 RepID=A0AA46SH14_CYTFI|nr:hypothetical protein [Cytobacillus firmus]UYG93185.1 hypothetical protein OD459_12895 [Cytobacillus firmus]